MLASERNWRRIYVHLYPFSIGTREAEETFGEVGILGGYKYDYAVRASAPTDLLFISTDALQFLLNENHEMATFLRSYVVTSIASTFISELFDLKGKLGQQELKASLSSVGIKRVKAGAIIFRQNEVAEECLYLVHHGAVNLVRDEKNNHYKLNLIKKGNIFGEAAFFENHRHMTNAIAKENTLLFVIPKHVVTLGFDYNNKFEERLKNNKHVLEKELQRQRKLAEHRARKTLIKFRSRDKRGEQVIKRFALVKQAEEMDCGAACLSMICKHYGVDMSLGRLRELANVTTEGASLDSLARVGDSLGFTTRGLRCTFKSLSELELPFIAHWKKYHYIVVYGISADSVWVADPGEGFQKMTIDEFETGWSGACLNFTATPALVVSDQQASPWVRFASYLRPHKPVLGYLLLATLVIQLLGVAPPIIVQNVLDKVVVHNNVELLTVLMIGLVIVNLFTQITTLMRGFLMNFMVRKLDFAMMSQFFRHTFSLPLSFFSKRRTGDIFARFQENETIRNFLTESTLSTVLNLLMVFVYFFVLAAYSLKLTTVLFVLVIPILILTVAVTPKIKMYARKTFETSTDAEATLMESLGGAESVKGMAIEREIRLKWEKKYAHSLDVRYKSTRFDLLVSFVAQLFNACITIVILWMGTKMVMSQELTIGQLIAFNMLLGSIMSPLMGLVGMWDEIHETGVALERLGDVLDLDPEQNIEQASTHIALPTLEGNISFKNIYFRYNETGPPVLENISFELAAGEVVAVVGQSGSGKTTLAKLLVGFYHPNEGSILVDGYDLKTLDKNYYRRQIGYVMQSNLLFSGTIAENIAIGDQSIQRRRVTDVARLADAHSFISAMPLAYEQVVGERGMGISGGQMQRICIARALYHNPRLLVFDEATSSLDTQSESNILNNMKSMLQGRTALIIAHRLSTVMHADKILVLYKGSIVEQGRHEELLARKGMYYQLVQKQIGNST